jgi:prepilin-type processing-associated H-X9-DG protein
LTDGLATTILLMEAADEQVRWAEPKDLSFTRAMELLTNPRPTGGHEIRNGFFYKPGFGRNVLFADGHVEFLKLPLDRKLAEALLTANGGEEIDLSALERVTTPVLDYAKCYAFAVFVALSLMPVGLAMRRSKGGIMPPTPKTYDAGESKLWRPRRKPSDVSGEFRQPAAGGETQRAALGSYPTIPIGTTICDPTKFHHNVHRAFNG